MPIQKILRERLRSWEMKIFLSLACSCSMLVSSHELYEFKSWRKVSYNGLGNQFWDKSAGSSIYRVAEAFDATMDDDDDDLAKPILAPFAHVSSWTKGGTPWTLLFDLSSIRVIATMDGLTYLSTNCSQAKSGLKRHQILSGTCKEATQQEACRLLRSYTIAWVDNEMLPCRRRRPRCARSHDHAFSSPFFFDPVKQRQGSVDSKEKLPYKHESTIFNPTLGMALRSLGFSNLIRGVAEDILKAVGCSLENIGAVHVRRGDRNKTQWRDFFTKEYGLFNESCRDCRSCVNRCTPTNEDLMFLRDNFTSPFVTVVWVASDDASIDSMLLHDAPTPSSSNSLVMVSQSSRFIKPIIDFHLREYTNFADLVFIRAAIDLYFLSYSNQAIFDLYSTFSAIAMRKREASEKLFMVW